MATYNRGDVARVTCTFRNGSGDVTDTTASVTVVAPDGTTTTPTPVHDSTGVYHVDITVDQGGAWHTRWVGAGVVAAVAPDVVWVRHPEGEPT